MGARENKCLEGALLLALSLTLVPRFLLRNRTETLATQASGLSELFFCFFFSLMRSWSQYTMGSRNEKSKGLWRIFVSGTWPKHKNRFFFQIFVPRLLAGWVKVAFSYSFLMKQISRNAFFASTSKQINDKNDLLCRCQMSNKLFTSESSQLKNASCIHTRLINT